MKYAVSNIAWLPSEDREVATYLKNSVITGIEIAPSRYFSDLENTSEQDFKQLRIYWNKLGFPITSLQSLLFNRKDLQLFGNFETREKLANYLLNLSAKAAILGAGPMVFGSPENRNRGNLTVAEAKISARKFFQKLNSDWGQNDSYLVLEANPNVYGCNFITKSSEARRFVELAGIPKLKWHLDLACTEASKESCVDLILNSHYLPSHIHLSELNLSPLNKKNTLLYRNFLNALESRGYLGVITLEMRKTKQIGDLFESIEILNGVSR